MMKHVRVARIHIILIALPMRSKRFCFGKISGPMIPLARVMDFKEKLGVTLGKAIKAFPSCEIPATLQRIVLCMKKSHELRCRRSHLRFCITKDNFFIYFLIFHKQLSSLSILY